MTIPELLKEAIDKQDFSFVNQAYELLTGIKIGTPKKIAKATKRGRPKAPTKSVGKKISGSVQWDGVNLFENMDIKTQKEKGYDRINDNVEPSPRRPPFRMVKKKCSECNKTIEVDPRIPRDSYTCNACSSPQKRRSE